VSANIEPTVEKADLEFAQGLFDLRFLMEGSGGSARATLTMSDGSTETFAWYHDEISYSPADFVGKTMTEIKQMHFDRDMAYLRA
jgi:hypothetical protein